MPIKSFLQDVLDQPNFLRKALDNYPIGAIEILYNRLQAEDFHKIILSGHGSSYNSLYPALIKLSSLSIPTILWQTAELLHYGNQQIDEKTLLCVNSQSGQSAEVVSLIKKIRDRRPACFLSLTNDPKSELGKNSDIVIHLHAGEERGVATKTYMNALSLASLLSAQLCGEKTADLLRDLRCACDAMEEYLANFKTRIEEINDLFGKIQNTIILGRGPSMATALNGALNQKEAARLSTEGMNAAEFRHGPLELADSNMTLIIIEGDPLTSKLNFALAEEVNHYGSKVIWIGNHSPAGVSSFRIPEVAEIARPLVELLPLQLLAHVLANRQKIEPGKFRRIGKIVLKE